MRAGSALNRALANPETASSSALDALFHEVQQGRGAALVVHGEAGIGKTRLLDRAVAAHAGVTVMRATGAEFEMELPYAALHQLCVPLASRFDALPPDLHEGLRVAFGLAQGRPAGLLLLGLAVLTLLSEHASHQPLVIVVDDAHWLDRSSAQVLAFVARRLVHEPVGIVFALREPSTTPLFASLRHLALAPLADKQARALIRQVRPHPLDQDIVARILAEARGNPLALMALTAAADLPGGLDSHAAFSHGAGRFDALFLRRVEGLSRDARLLLVLAAAEPIGDPALLQAAAATLAIGEAALDECEAADLLEVHGKVRFRHPLVRSVAYLRAAGADRRQVHGALAQVTLAESDPDRKAWHGALAIHGPSDEQADLLELSAKRAQQRGGVWAAAAFLERSAALTASAEVRARRQIAAAEMKLHAGATAEAAALLDAVSTNDLDALLHAKLTLLRGRLAFAVRRGAEATDLLCSAARLLEPLDAVAARDAHLDALFSTLLDGRMKSSTDETAKAAARMVATAPGQRAVDQLLAGFLHVAQGNLDAGFACLHAGLRDTADPVWLPRIQMAAVMSFEVWDLAVYFEHTEAAIRRARDIGALVPLAQALSVHVGALLRAGRMNEATSVLEEAESLISLTHTPPAYSRLTLMAWQGSDGTGAAIAEMVASANARGEDLLLGFSDFAEALWHNGMGRHAQARDCAARAVRSVVFIFKGAALRELVEGAARSGDLDAAEQALALLAERTQAAGTDWALGTEACCRALVSTGDAADQLHREALRLMESAGCLGDLARARLLYGEWLRREGRRREASEQLGIAHKAFLDMGAQGFAERAERELLAAGEQLRTAQPSKISLLTPQESEIARRAATGASSKEIAAQLFLSPRTIDAHLRSIFGKLGVNSRKALCDLPEVAAHAREPQRSR